MVGDIAGLIAAIAFVLLVGALAIPLVKLGRVLDEARTSLREATDHTVPILDEAAKTIVTTNGQLEKVDTITTSAAQVSANVSALSGLWAATIGRPLIKVSAFTYGVRQAYAKAAGRDGGATGSPDGAAAAPGAGAGASASDAAADGGAR